MTNFLTHPILETIQAFLIISNVLSYNMNPGVSYILLGMAVRMAFSIGLQTDSQRFNSTEQYLRRRVWWALAWQDSHFCVCYDRPSASTVCGTEIPYRPESRPGKRSYAESMFQIIQLTQEILKARMLKPRSNLPWSSIQEYTERITRIVADGYPHLRDRANCRNGKEHLERLALRIHCTYLTSELLRPALREGGGRSAAAEKSPTNYSSDGHYRSPTGKTDFPSEQQLAHFRLECIRNLAGVVDAYVEVHGVSSHAARSWIGIQRTISAAFLLGVTQETQQDPQINRLLRQLEACISERARMERAFGDPMDSTQPAESPNWARSMAHALKALSKMNAALATSAGPGTSMTPVPGYPLNAQPLHLPIGDHYWPLKIPSPHSAIVMPATPESTSSSGDWNYTNLGERAAEFVMPTLWS